MKRLLIIDSFSLIHRAYHALPHLSTKKGELVNAVYGFLLIFFRALKDFKPDYITACFDLSEPTFRHKEFKGYKATRPKTPEDLVSQISKVRKILESFSVPIFEKQGFEADDLLATIATKFKNNNEVETIIISGDLDTLQLVDDNTKVYALRKGVKNAVLYDKEKVFERYGLSPVLLSDYKALVGDQSDNIPGVSGIGPKTAIKLLQEFETLENLYEKLPTSASASVKTTADKKAMASKQIPNKLKEKLIKYKDQAFLSKKLAQLQINVPLNFDLVKCKLEYNKKRATAALKELEFESLISKLPEKNFSEENGKPKTLF